MLYPINIKIKKKEKIKIIKEKLQNLKHEIKRNMIYLIFDRTNLGKIIAVKLHI